MSRRTEGGVDQGGVTKYHMREGGGLKSAKKVSRIL